MSWGQDVTVLKAKFVREFAALGANRAEVCRAYGISRDTGYRLAKRSVAIGALSFVAQSRAPHSHPSAVGDDVIELVLALRDGSPRGTWGASKILHLWQRNEIQLAPPSRATITRILRDYHRSAPPRLRHLAPQVSAAPAPAECANDVWAIDAKGLWRGVDPLSVIDVHSRFLLALADVPIDTKHVQHVTGRLFDRHGAPRRIRCDGGPPFGGCGVAKLTKLVVWWMDQGVVVEHVGKPQHNGHVERFHRTLKQEASRQLGVADALRQFRDSYNEWRPHEMLDGQVPAEAYRPEPVARNPPQVPYFDDDRRVHADGMFTWAGKRVFISDALASRTITFRALERHLWIVRYRHLPLALLNERRMQLLRCPREFLQSVT